MNRNFNLLLSAYATSLVGDWLFKFALPLLIYNESKSPLMMAVAYGATYVPNIFFTIVGGAFADLFEKKRVLILGDIFAALFACVLFLIYFLGLSSVGITLVFVLLISTASAFYYPAHQGIIPDIVDEHSLAAANAKMRSIDSIFLILGPSLSAIIISIASVEWALLINAFSFIFSAYIISKLKLSHKTLDDNEESSIITFNEIKIKMAEGVKIAITYPQLKHACILFVMINIAISMYYSNLIFLLKSHFHASDYQLGILFSIIGIGALLGSLASKKIIEKLNETTTIIYAVFFSSLFFVLLIFAKNAWLVAIIWAGVTFCNSCIIVSYFTLRQKLVPKRNISTVVAVTRSFVIMCIPIGSFVGGLILDLSNQFSVLVSIASMIMIFSVFYAVFSPFNSKVGTLYVENNSTHGQ